MGGRGEDKGEDGKGKWDEIFGRKEIRGREGEKEMREA
jgi:hypothetical protein